MLRKPRRQSVKKKNYCKNELTTIIMYINMCVGCSSGHDGSIVQDQLSLAYIYTQQYGMCVGIVNVIIICSSVHH